MKKLVSGLPASLNRYWSELEDSGHALWLVKDSKSRRLIELQKPGMAVIDLPGWCRLMLAQSGLLQIRLIEDWQQLALLRLALSDSRCQGITFFRQALEFPGSQKRLLVQIHQLIQRQLFPELALESGVSDELAQLRQIYEQLQQQSHLCDEHTILARFIELQHEPALLSTIHDWVSNLNNGSVNQPVIAIPRADQFSGLALAITLPLCDVVRQLQVGLAMQQFGPNEIFLKAFETWMMAGGNFENIALDQPDLLSEVKHFQFGNQASEISSVLTIIRKIRDENPATRVVVYTPGGRQEADYVSSALRRAGISHAGPGTALVEKPEVRTALDIANAVRDDWPATDLVDLLRNPAFEFEQFPGGFTRRDINRLAGDIQRLGEVNGIYQIRESLYYQWDEAEKFRLAPPPSDFQRHAMDMLAGIQIIATASKDEKTWSEWAAWLREMLLRLLGIAFSERLGDFWQILDEYGEMEKNLSGKLWSLSAFLKEIQLAVEQRVISPAPDNASEVVLYHGELPEFSVAGEWVCCGMVEGYYPNRKRLREGLRKGKSKEEMQDFELNCFAELGGHAFQRLVFTSSRINNAGDEVYPSGLLDSLPVSEFNRIQWGNDQAAACLTEEASRFFRRGVTLFKTRLTGDSRYLGLISGDSATGRLSEYFNQDYGFSPTSLESASLCPFQFFASQVLKISENEISDDLETDYLLEGNIIHAVLEDIHKCLPELSNRNLDEIGSHMPQIIDQYFEASDRVKQSVATLARWKIQRRRLEHRLLGYVEQLEKQIEKDSRQYSSTGRVFGVELNTRDSGCIVKPLVLEDSQTGTVLKIHGRIDRIDQFTEAGNTFVRIIDYKSGGKIHRSEVVKRIHLQLPIYAMMLDGLNIKQKLSEKQIEFQVNDAGFWYLKRSAGGYQSISPMLFEKNEKFDVKQFWPEFKELIVLLIQKIRNGEYMIRPKVPKCEEKCPMMEVCRIQEIRNYPEMG